MKTVKIINGAYGQRVGSKTRLVRLGELCQVDDQEAARLVGMQVAAYVGEEPEPAPPVSPAISTEESGGDTPGQGDEHDPERDAYTPDELNVMTKDSLLKIANQLGLHVNARMSKTDIIQALHSALTHADEPAPPDLSPEGPVV